MQPIKKGSSKLAEPKLLIDENISWRLKRLLPEWDVLPVNEIKADGKINDASIWNYAKSEHYSILTFDEDFVELQNLYGHPPKIIWLRMGNVTTNEIAQRLIQLSDILTKFIEDNEAGVIEMY